MSKKKKLLIISTTQLRGGAEEYLLMVGQAAMRRGWETYALIEKLSGTEQLRDDFLKNGIICHDARISDVTCNAEKKSGILRQCIGIFLVLIKVCPNVVLVNMPGWTTALGALLACALLKIPTLVTFHLFPWRCKFGKKRIRLYQWFLARNQKWIAVSENNRKYISETFQVDKNTIHVIYNGVKKADLSDIALCRKSVREELKLQDNAYIILTVARLDILKGYQDIIPVITQLRKADTRIKFVWVGEGQHRDALIAMVKDHGLDDCVLFLGHRRDIYRLMKASDLFLFPSRAEGFGLVLLEAMACGLPIISSDANAIPEVIHNGVHARLFSVGDSRAMLACIESAMSDCSTTQMLARNALSRSYDFSEEQCAQRTFDLIEEFFNADK